MGTPAVGALIEASHYNAIQAKIALVMGSGSGDYGYGQAVSSSSVSQNGKITVAQWNNLREDIRKAREHITGVAIGNYSPSDVGYTAGNDLKIPTTSIKIKEEDRNAYMTMADYVTTNRLAIPPAGQATREDLVAAQQRTALWSGVVSQTITVTFDDANAARYYFNTGSRFEFSSTFVNNDGVVGGKGSTWNTLLTNMGTIYFNYNDVTCTGTGTTSSIGWSDLTTSDQLVFEKYVSGSTYYPNRYQILARAPTSNTIVFTIVWRDDSGQPNAPWGTDENVNGTLTSYAQVYRSSGTVSVNKPNTITTGI